MRIHEISRALAAEGQEHCVVAAPAKDNSKLLREWALNNRVSEAAFAQLLSIIGGKIKAVTPLKAVYKDSLGNKTYVERTELGRIKCFNHANISEAISNILFRVPKANLIEGEFVERLKAAKSDVEYLRILKVTTQLPWDLVK